ncbi:MAG: tonB-system energizer ExbB [Rhodanobacter sp.]
MRFRSSLVPAAVPAAVAMLALLLGLAGAPSAGAQEASPATAGAAMESRDQPAPGLAAPDGQASDHQAGEGTATDAEAGAVEILPRDLSPWGMFAAADRVVQAVMVGLALASVATWTVLQVKLLELGGARRRARAVADALAAARSLGDVAGRFGARDGVAGALVAAARVELEMSGDTLDKDGIKERIGLRFARLEAAGARRMMRATGLLATIGATAPFVGLFGTVWGIMNSFIGISEAQTTNLAIVAPGIAEALLATALGLVAAVPAVVIYNMFSRAIGGYRALLADAAAEVMRLVSRDLDRAGRARFAAE